MSEKEAGKNLYLCPGYKDLSPLKAVSAPNNEKSGSCPVSARNNARIMWFTFKDNTRELGFLYGEAETDSQEGQVTCPMPHS